MSLRTLHGDIQELYIVLMRGGKYAIFGIK